MDCIFNALSIPDEEVVELALKNLAEVPAVGYPFLNDYIQKIGETTIALLSSGSPSCIKYSLLFWTGVCKEEAKLGQNNHGVITKCADSLINIVLQAIKISEYDNDDIILADSNDDEAWTVIDAAAGLLQDIAFLVKDSVWNSVWQFFMTQLSLATW